MTKSFVTNIALAAALLCVGQRSANAQTYTVLHAFTGADGGEPLQGVVLDRQGNIYGTTAAAGPGGAGNVFKSDPNGNVTVLHGFDALTTGEAPQGAGFLALDGDTLFGTTGGGGGPTFCGLIYSLKTDGSAYTILHEFDGTDGCSSDISLQRVPGRGFVGATASGGVGFRQGSNNSGLGVLYAMTRSGRYTKLHGFSGSPDGNTPTAVLADNLGNVFGSTYSGGVCTKYTTGCGVIYQYNLSTKAYTVLYDFTGTQDGGAPTIGSVGADGTLYGTTQYGSGPAHYGTLFKLTPSGGTYTLTTLANFNATTFTPFGGPTLTPQNGLVGVSGGALYGYNGGKLKVLQSFLTPDTGLNPMAQPAVAPGGTIIGTTYAGGVPSCAYPQLANSCGVLYRYTAR